MPLICPKTIKKLVQILPGQLECDLEIWNMLGMGVSGVREQPA